MSVGSASAQPPSGTPEARAQRHPQRHAFDKSLVSVPIAAEVPDFDPERELPGAGLISSIDSQLALVAAREASADAALVIDDSSRDRAGVSIGSGVGATTQDALYRRYYSENNARPHPFSIPRTM